jgi:hypothetical protein
MRTEAYEKSWLASVSLGGDAKRIKSSDARQRAQILARSCTNPCTKRVGRERITYATNIRRDGQRHLRLAILPVKSQGTIDSISGAADS